MNWGSKSSWGGKGSKWGDEYNGKGSWGGKPQNGSWGKDWSKDDYQDEAPKGKGKVNINYTFAKAALRPYADRDGSCLYSAKQGGDKQMLSKENLREHLAFKARNSKTRQLRLV